MALQPMRNICNKVVTIPGRHGWGRGGLLAVGRVGAGRLRLVETKKALRHFCCKASGAEEAGLEPAIA